MFVKIGEVIHGFSDDYVRENSGRIEGYVRVFDEYAEGLEGIEEYSHLFLLSFLDKISEDKRRILKIKPRRLLRLGYSEEQLPEVGVLSSDSPIRPNPIGLTLVKLINREKTLLHVYGLDLFNKTPIIDIKPFRETYTTSEFKVPNWVMEYDRKQNRL
ncbi:MAG TPA: tRNA (N6-threonylcarbamoyladenosine(37)-N6)-methyltransferase TrmO [Candidatus Caldiarchaeum subterraneum]|uniref:tRNA (N6-threonylcarbamoyladenosine(37)-N6)-methyltransferase TrmO n=1 Tax=Caldiarchaeum subterraneum TaxID=311458 RepID=A0A833EBX4_CALS0|nr:tRNA (N6-threonylcarbamoyladenosine(37)-N6)-methyltransferase TrmO [Aigarchaeota archaeon]HIQ29719.1 tRNA (N6-threonylcarbamoyladenosine(37)-N6)-methyltransferase TrmO [Candidatus Caldarchaeum subterraneum]